MDGRDLDPPEAAFLAGSRIRHQPLQPVEYLFERCRSKEELREQLGKIWSARRNELLEAGAGSIEQVESIVKQAYDDGLLPNDDQPS